jgi:SAM-dependent methyltransferase
MNRDKRKACGIHYTPPELARFLARVTLAPAHLPKASRRIEILDPACGDGGLLQAAHEAVPARLRGRVTLYGFETDREAVEQATQRLAACGARDARLQGEDFLTLKGLEACARRERPQEPSEGGEAEYVGRFDAIIANPPYVRTQVLGSDRAQELARRFGLTGRVDLYHAFVRAMANALKPGGVLGLLTSNRFLTVKSGAALRRLLRDEFCLEAIYDMGDTRLFAAAVLPVIVVARKQSPGPSHRCAFHRVYEHRTGPAVPSAGRFASVLDAVADRAIAGTVEVGNGCYRIERGSLREDEKNDVWALATPESEQWLATVRSHQVCVFDDLGVIRVGVKTTADRVFIRDDWHQMPAGQRPERALLRPLVTHAIASRWRSAELAGRTWILYPHATKNGKRAAVELGKYPQAAKYLSLHRERLEGRKYVVDAGRRWYEIWVPHDPAAWQKPKIVFPDIAESPRFFLDRSGAVVNGDCYWITLKAGVAEDWLLLMLAVANSSFIPRYYDVVFHNKLYAGRRRFMTQYVQQFPMPSLDGRLGQRLVGLASELVDDPGNRAKEAEADRLVWRVFGLEPAKK